ncbi:centromere protein H (CENP-H)-domain-containing protein [Lipomyces arxii]|uniref:centromere protein H (CENP-H)-domain-containing protein n=1 Tax=Lipomyces arxii TaxID=56418 RepID=UPI0034CD090B
MDSLESVSTQILKLCVSSTTGIVRLKDVPTSQSLAGGMPSLQSPSATEKRIHEVYKQLGEIKRQQLKSNITPDDPELRPYATWTTEELKAEAERTKKLADIRSVIVSGSLFPISLLQSKIEQETQTDAVVFGSGLEDKSVEMTLKLHKEIADLKLELLNEQKRNKERHRKNRERTAEIIRLAERQKERQRESMTEDERQKLTTLKESIKRSSEKIRTLQAVILGIVLASGLDWASDENLRRIVLQCSANDFNSADEFDDET